MNCKTVPTALMSLVVASLAVGWTGVSMAGEGGHGEHEHESEKSKGPVTLTGEVVDLMCYLDHGARGKGHKDCAQKCIRKNGPVGLLVESKGESGHHEKSEKHPEKARDGHGGHHQSEEKEHHESHEERHAQPEKTVYLIIGQHEPINGKLAPRAAKRITVRGKVVERAGMKMIENVRIVETGEVVEKSGEAS